MEQPCADNDQETLTNILSITKMKTFKYKIDGKDYQVEIGEISEDNIAEVKVNDQAFQVELEKPAEPEAPKAPTQEELLTEILAVLKEQQAANGK